MSTFAAISSEKLMQKFALKAACFLLIFWWCSPQKTAAQKQQRYTISGYVTDKSSSEKLIGVNIYDPIKKVGTTSNVYGYYSITLPADTYQFYFSYVGFQALVLAIDLKNDTLININLSQSLTLKEVVVEAERKKESIEDRVQMSRIEIPVKTVEQLPVLLGERDILKTIQLLPGVQSGTEGSSGIYVRGGGPDQNLILLDGVPVYNVSHLFGFFSLFTPEAVNNISLIKGGFPARYGGRLSSVLDIRMKEGNMHKYKGEVSVGLIASKAQIEGPIIKGKSSFIVSGRRTYIDLLSRPFQAMSGPETPRFGYYFYDFNAKTNYKFSDKDHLYLSFYLGNDKAFARTNFSGFGSSDRSNFNLTWGNIIGALRWNHVFTPKLFANTTLTYSRYRFLTGIELFFDNPPDVYSFNSLYFSGIEDWGVKTDFDYNPHPNHKIRFGIGNTYHTFKPGASTYRSFGSFSLNIDTTMGSNNVFAHELSTYVEDELKISSRLKANIGVHASAFVLGTETYWSVQPRLATNYKFAPTWSAKASFCTMTQFLHLLTNSSLGLPTDLWVPATRNVKPQDAWQAAVGIAKTLPMGFELSIEGFYKEMNNLIEYKEGASYLDNSSNWERMVETGKGQAYGAEVFIQRQEGKLNGWFGYTLSWANRTFENLNEGRTFPYRYDRRHDISIALSYEINDKIDIGTVWVYGTGRAITLPTETYPSNINTNDIASFFNYSSVQHFDSRNAFREPNYHRLDLSLNRKTESDKGVKTWSFGVYNAYSRMNPFFLYFNEENNRRQLKQVSLFPLIPFITFNYKWK